MKTSFSLPAPALTRDIRDRNSPTVSMLILIIIYALRLTATT